MKRPARHAEHAGVVAQLFEILEHLEHLGSTALMRAAVAGSPGVVAKLLEKEAEVDKRKQDGCTALMHAAREGHVAVVTELLDKKAEVDAQRLPTTGKDWQRLVKELHDEGVDATTTWEDGITPLMVASKRGHAEVVAKLLEKEARVNETANNGTTALMRAAVWGHADMVEQLLEICEFRCWIGCEVLGGCV